MKKIITYNVNGIRAAINKGLFEWVVAQKADIICFQETKSQPEQVDLADFEKLGYHAYWHSAEKKGYSGVLTLSKEKADKVVVGIGISKYDQEGRILRTDFGDWTLLNCYFPSGSASEERHEFKMEFLNDIEPYFDDLKKERSKIIVVGDYNIVHEDIDIHNPTRKDKPSGFRPEERAWLSNWFQNGFVDAYRVLYPNEITFSWWSYRAGSRGKNKGWRIDYISVSESEKDNIKEVQHFKDAEHSDHCAVALSIES